jgi:hypothetical protein
MTVATAMRDERLPSAPEVLGEAGLEAAASVAEEAGGSVDSIRARQALYTPGEQLIVNFHARMTGPAGEAREEVVAAVADNQGLPQGAPVQLVCGQQVAMWRFPQDPVLSSLHRVVDTESLSEMLGYLHLEPRRVKITPLVYRPTRRAVVRLSLKSDTLSFDRAAGRIEMHPGEREIYLKIVQPRRAEHIGRVHDELGAHLPIPRCYGAWSDEGLLALEGLPGMTLRDFIRKETSSPPSPEQLLALLDGLPEMPFPMGRVRSMRRRVRDHERLLRTILPDHERRVRRLGRVLRALPSERPAVVHGDFYDSQVIVNAAGAVTGLLDLDGVGWGDPTDDMASMLGRIWTSGQTEGKGRDRFRDYAGELLDTFSRRTERHDLCMRVAAIVFGRSTGPFRAQVSDWRDQALERIELAELCVERATRGELPA